MLINKRPNFFLIITFLLCLHLPLKGQFILHVQDWEGSGGAGNWLRNENTVNKWTRGTDPAGLSNGSRTTYISSNGYSYGYDNTSSAESYAYKDITFPTIGDFYVKLDWKCVGESGSDYLKIFLIPTNTILNETSLENAVDGIRIDGPDGYGAFSGQNVFSTLNYALSENENALVRGKTYRLLALWINNNNTISGAPAAIDDIVISDGDATQRLVGTYQIGANATGNKRFAYLPNAFSLLNINGVSDDVTFELTDEFYNIVSQDLPITIRDFNSNPKSSSNTANFTFQPIQDGMLTPSISGNRANDEIFFFDRASNVNINGNNGGGESIDLQISNNSTTNAQVLNFGSNEALSEANHNIIIKNVDISAGNSGINGNSRGINFSNRNDFSPGEFSNINISNCNFRGAHYGVFLNGNASNISGHNIEIRNNTFNDISSPIKHTAVYATGIDGLQISQNVIGNIQTNNSANNSGIHLGQNTINTKIEKNEIYNITHSNGYGSHGISINTSNENAQIDILNNMIYDISGAGFDYSSYWFDNPIGIAIRSGQSGISIQNNSIYLRESIGAVLPSNHNAYSACIAIESGATVNEVKNNILINNLGGNNSAFQPKAYTTIAYNGTFTNHFPDIDYNFYYNQVGSIAGGNESLATNFTNSASSLADLQILSKDDLSSIGASRNDIGSFNGDGFTFDSERLFNKENKGLGNYLEIDGSQKESWLIKSAGTHLVNMNEDFKGNERNTDIREMPPSMGPFEFTTSTEPVKAYQKGSIAEGLSTEFHVGNRKILSLKWRQSGGSFPTDLEINYYPGQQPPNQNGTAVLNGYIKVNASGGSGFKYDIEIAYEPALLAGISPSDIVLTKRSDHINDWSTWNTSVNTAKRIYSVSNIDNGFSYFTGTDQNDPLPVELISFTAQPLSGEIQIHWETATEKNNDHFIVEKKELNNEWRNISTVKGAVNSSALIQYSISDLNPFSGTQYYRLKQVDTDGKFVYSNALRVDYGSFKQEVFPNPFKDKFFIKTNGENSIERIELKNITGKVINTTNKYLGQNKWEINIPSPENGIYILYLYMGNHVDVQKLIKQ